VLALGLLWVELKFLDYVFVIDQPKPVSPKPKPETAPQPALAMEQASTAIRVGTHHDIKA
jgi:hypothetical protein